jgi:hypothetical protein
VIFSGAEHRRFWRIFTRRGWRHVQVLLPVYYPEQSLGAETFSMVVNPLAWGVQATVLFRSPRELAQEALKEGATAVIKFRVDEKFQRDYVPRGLFSCVTLLKAVLQISAWYVWTPEHLARYLLRNGGELVKRAADHDGSIRRLAAEAETRSGHDQIPAKTGRSASPARAGRAEGSRRSATADGS